MIEDGDRVLLVGKDREFYVQAGNRQASTDLGTVDLSVLVAPSRVTWCCFRRAAPVLMNFEISKNVESGTEMDIRAFLNQPIAPTRKPRPVAVDIPLLLAVIALCVFGLLMLYSASKS
jgi:acetolactate synthase regulatory subunit